ncbi:MAG: class I SAM-dependent methyltransferase [Spirochaetales bacterium]
MPEWFEDEDFWIAYAPLMFDESRWAEVPEVVDNLIRLSSLAPGARVLDLCCGVGRHTVELSKRGFRVTGVDITAAYLSAAKETAEAAGADPELVLDDARRFKRPASFDLCLNLFTSFGYFATREDDILMLGNCAKNLAPGGCLILETIGKETAARDFVAREDFSRAGWNVTTEYSVVGDWEGEMNRWIARNATTCVDRSFVLRLYSGYEMKQALREAGFASSEIFGGLDGRRYDEKAESLVAIARV